MLRKLALVFAVLVVAAFVTTGRVTAAGLVPTNKLEAVEAQSRSQDDMRRFARTPPVPDGDQERDHPALKQYAVSPRDLAATADGINRSLERRVIPFLPTVDRESYLRQKAEKAKEGAANKPSQSKAAAEAELALVIPNFDGATDVDGLLPPDTHGAVGLVDFVEVTNSHIDIYRKDSPANHTSVSLAAFFGYSTRTLFDPRAVYDTTWNRWIVTADAFAESATVQYHFIAVSQSFQAAGPYYIYRLNVTFNPGDFWDYPQLGMDQDAIVVTANVFPSSGAPKAAMFAVAKARLYNGLGFAVPVFTGLVPTLAPPIVLDQNSKTFLIAAPGGAVLKLYTLQDAGKSGVSLSAPADIAVGTYSIPPSAPQPGTSAKLDTLDGRFVNASTQVNSNLWQVHTVALGPFSAPRFYQINTTTNSVVQSGFFYATGTSFDFNASITATSDNDAFFTWSTTDPSAGTNAQVRVAACDHSQPIAPGPGLVLFTSPTFYTGGRWGDYSAVTPDPSNRRRAWAVNETIRATTHWGSRIGAISLP
jgi:hypothetical protein